MIPSTDKSILVALAIPFIIICLDTSGPVQLQISEVATAIPLEHYLHFPRFTGIAYSLLRAHQLKDQLSPSEIDSLVADARARIDSHDRSADVDINPGRPSPITSPMLGALVLRVLYGQRLEQDPQNLLAVMELAISQPPTFLFRERVMGVDEVLYGRAGLLWAVLEIWKRCPDQETQTAFAPAF
jgi:hypothetical protein